MESEKVAGILGAIVAAAVLVIAFVYWPAMGRAAKPVQKIRSAGCRAAAGQGAGGARSAAIGMRPAEGCREALAERPDRPYLASNGDVDAS